MHESVKPVLTVEIPVTARMSYTLCPGLHEELAKFCVFTHFYHQNYIVPSRSIYDLSSQNNC